MLSVESLPERRQPAAVVRSGHRLELLDLGQDLRLKRAVRILIAQPLKELNGPILVAVLAEPLERVG